MKFKSFVVFFPQILFVLIKTDIRIQDGDRVGESYTHLLPGPSGIQLKYRARPRITKWILAERKSYNQGSTEAAFEIGRKGRDAKRAGPAPWLCLRFQMDISAVGCFPWEEWRLKPKSGSLTQSSRAGKRCPHNIWMWKSTDSVCQGKT